MTKQPINLDSFRSSGLLWLINVTVFHPRGFALAIEYENGKPTGMSLLGDGKEPWCFSESERDGTQDSFDVVNALFVSLRDRR